MIVGIFHLIGSSLFIIGSLYTVIINCVEGHTENVWCLTTNCHYDSSLWFLVGCFCFLMGNTVRILMDYEGSDPPRKRIMAINEFGSLLFLIGSVIYFIGERQQGMVMFFSGSCIFSVSTIYDYAKYRNKVSLVFLGGSVLFIIGDLVSNGIIASVMWLIGSILFTVGSLTTVKTDNYLVIPRDPVELV